jgi:hypothetical protein
LPTPSPSVSPHLFSRNMTRDNTPATSSSMHSGLENASRELEYPVDSDTSESSDEEFWDEVKADRGASENGNNALEDTIALLREATAKLSLEIQHWAISEEVDPFPKNIYNSSPDRHHTPLRVC